MITVDTYVGCGNMALSQLRRWPGHAISAPKQYGQALRDLKSLVQRPEMTTGFSVMVAVLFLGFFEVCHHQSDARCVRTDDKPGTSIFYTSVVKKRVTCSSQRYGCFVQAAQARNPTYGRRATLVPAKPTTSREYML